VAHPLMLRAIAPALEHTAAAEAELGDNQPVTDARLLTGQFARTRPAPEGAAAAIQDSSERWSDHCADVGPGDR
jgi:hypothetical protein